MFGSRPGECPHRGVRSATTAGGIQAIVIGLALVALPLAADDPVWQLDMEARWQPLPSNPAPTVAADGVSFPCPFPSGVDRHVWDVPVPRSFSADGVHGLEWTYTLEPADAFRGLTWYVRSGPGWYAAALPVRSGRQRAWVPFSSFEREGAVAGWNSVNRFRLSPWSSGEGSGTVHLHGVQARRARIAVVMPSAKSVPLADERPFARNNAERWLADLSRLDQPAIPLDEEGLRAADLRPFKVVILPYNPQPASPLRRALLSYVRQGGALWVCYSADTDLAAAAGVTPGVWRAAGPANPLHQWAFTDMSAWEGPARVVQSAPHILPIRPAHDEAEVLAFWADTNGRPQSEPAIIATPHGVWFSHLLGRDDDAARLRALAFMLDRYLPSAALAAVKRKAETLAAQTTIANGPAVQRAQAATQRALERGSAGTAWDRYAEWVAAHAADDRIETVWPADVALGIWDHSGRGLYPGDWARTWAELRATGFTDAFVYVRYGGTLSSRAVRTAQEAGIKLHVWPIVFNVESADTQTLAGYRRDGRLQTGADGTATTWLCPALPANRESELERVLALAATHGVQGLHLDYVRYPDADYCYGPECQARFEAHYGRALPNWPDLSGATREAFVAWRADAISQFVEAVSAAMAERYPDVNLSAAVWPDVNTVKAQLGQDWPRWLANEWVDFVVPMSYTEREAELKQWTARQLALPGAAGRVWAGLGVTASHTQLGPGATLRQAQAAIEEGVAGVVVFDLNTTVANEIFPALRRVQHRAVAGE